MAAIEPEGFSSIVRPHEEHGNALTRALSSSSAFSDRKRQRAYDSSDEDNKKEKSMAADWSLMPELQAMQQQSDKDQAKRRDLGVTWKNLTVKKSATLAESSQMKPNSSIKGLACFIGP